MGYIIKNTQGLINTRLTDTGRQKLSQGSFNISYFQIGDSEVSYNTLPSTYNQFDTVILEPSFNAQNSAGSPQSNKENVKYPYYVDGSAGNTYGIPFMDSSISPVFNRAVMRGFFTGDTSQTPINWSALTNENYAVNPNYIVKMSSLNGSNKINIIYDLCSVDAPRMPSVGDIITIYYDGNGLYNCYCEGDNPTTTTTTYCHTNYNYKSYSEPFLEVSPSPTPTPTNENPCASPTPTPTPTATFCPTPTPSSICPKPPTPDCVMDIKSCYPILTYRIVDICFDLITLDRPTPDFSYLNGTCYGRAIVYPPTMIPFYDSYTPRPHWNDDVINYESVCYTDQFDVKIWNMNIPWSENPAGLYSSINKDYTQFGSIQYLGTKEYLGYASSSGQTDSSSVYYFNSLGDKITVKPEDQKAIGIVHYTNKTIDLFYGEKFALEPYEDVDDTTGQAREFRVHIPWIMWHKNPDCCHGQTFWVDPPGFDTLNLFQVQYLRSNKNDDMNNPGMRYYHLWDNHPGIDGIPNRVGKVFPDARIIVFDDEEIIAAMSYKSNRNWTLPSPRLSLITPNTCGTDTNSVTGILTADTETVYITYRLGNSRTFTNYLHSNYYSAIQGPNLCLPFSSQNVAVRFGPEFPCLNQPFVPTTTTTTFNPTTTTTTSPIIANCYNISSTATCENPCIFEYVNYDGVTSYIAVDIENSPIRICSRSTPKSFCDSYEMIMGDFCYSNLDCNPCWLTGFTFVVQGYPNKEVTTDMVFVPTSYSLNGYPIFTNTYFSSNIYFNGTDWVLKTIYCEPPNNEIIIGNGSSPLGVISVDCSPYVFSGVTTCKQPNNLCFELTYKSFSTPVGWYDLYQITTSSGVIFYQNFNGDYTCTYNTVTSDWELTQSPSILMGTLSGLGPNDYPIGNWTPTPLSGLVFLNSTSGNCNQNCFCISLSNLSDVTPSLVNYYDCEGIIQNFTLSAGQTTEIYFETDFETFGGSVSATKCEPVITSPNKSKTHKTTVYPYTTTTTSYNPYTTTTTTCPIFCDQFTGFFADTFEVLVQKVPTGERPSSSEWKVIDFTNQLTSTMINGFITQEGLTGNTFVVSQQDYDNAPYYNLNDYIPLTQAGFSGSQLNFGDEYYFYGNIETDIQATIYEMRYKINLGQSEFQSSSNPSWTPGTQSYVTEIGLYDSQKNLMIISKMQSPVVRQGIQQFLVKFDF